MQMRLLWAAAVLLGAAALSLCVYHFASAKVEVLNHSDVAVEELVLVLPSSRVSIGPVEPAASSRVYFSAQEASGEARYRLVLGDGVELVGGFDYAVEEQWFRTIRFTVESGGVVHVSVSG
ncbi:hypothetical protein [Pseudomarimonas salicorniae]|uniref:Uncharacterized protein n=1 Tax=Pseudomarimonas salicorniae TaxID=2933270 RepID=A0ABT0GLP5_9GAMM|nr:hypothetical protein [Lysobacter sp. CAU 1642]MCK7595459.1 hypothetical protein [Lysobacter sp. CAU 1642]